MLGYSGGAQVMIFYLPIYLQTTYDYAPIQAGLAMLPFALPMFLVPKLGARLSNRFTAKSMLGIALTITAAANVVMSALSECGVGYWVFAVAMIAGVGAGLLNTETAKAMQGGYRQSSRACARGLARLYDSEAC